MSAVEKIGLLASEVANASGDRDRNRWDCSNRCRGLVCAIIVVPLLALLTSVWLYAGYNGYCLTNHTEPLVKDYNGGQFFTTRNMSHPPPKDRWDSLRGELADHFTSDGHWSGQGGHTYGYASAEDMPGIIYRGTKVEGVFEQVPEKYRGVFWMDGNPLPEVLGTFQYGKYFEKERVLLVPNIPFYWAYWGLENQAPPRPASSVQRRTYEEESGRSVAFAYSLDSVNKMWVVAPKGLGFSFAKLQMNHNGDLSNRHFHNKPPLHYTFEELRRGVKPGTLWWRGRTRFCRLLPQSGYWAKKIIDGDGNKVEPYFSQYIRFVGGNKLITWSGGPGF